MISGSCSTTRPQARHTGGQDAQKSSTWQPVQFDTSDDAGQAAKACRLQQTQQAAFQNDVAGLRLCPSIALLPDGSRVAAMS